MPEFRHTSEMTVDAGGEGWTVSTVADGSHVPGMPMVARLWHLEPGVTGPEETWEEGSERFLYVVSGAGSLVIGDEVMDLAREDMAWIERGDRFRLQAAGGEPLAVLDAASS
ncbi:MAG: cupin domain-containing protein [Solirubrobacteraceae bacterium]